MPAWYRWDDADLILRVQVQPRASQEGLVGVHGDCVKVRVTAAPVEGRANTEVIALLARAFGTAKGRVQLERGHTGKIKVFRVQGPTRFPAELPIRRPAEAAGPG